MKISGAPCEIANSLSWWTGMKSREATAPATIMVAVSEISRGVTASPTFSEENEIVGFIRESLPD